MTKRYMTFKNDNQIIKQMILLEKLMPFLLYTLSSAAAMPSGLQVDLLDTFLNTVQALLSENSLS